MRSYIFPETNFKKSYAFRGKPKILILTFEDSGNQVTGREKDIDLFVFGAQGHPPDLCYHTMPQMLIFSSNIINEPVVYRTIYFQE